VSDRQFTAGSSNGSFQAQMYRRGSKGDLALVDVDFNDYVTPPKGSRGRFMLHGWSPTYETQSSFDGQTKVITRMRAEYRIEKISGRADLTGKLFSQQFPIPRNISDDRSKLGQFLRALLNREFVPGESVNPDDFIGTTFVTSTTLDVVGDKQYAGISWETIDPAKTVLSPYVNADGAQPALVPAGGVPDDENPFEGFEGDDDL
jgi:hypothetical protein